MTQVNMTLWQISPSNLADLIKGLLKKNRIIVAPVVEGKIASYQPITRWEEICLGWPYPTKSAKEYFFPQSEEIVNYQFDEASQPQLSILPEIPEIILFGLRPCEAASFSIMARVFSWDYQDNFYLKRREKNLVISLACEQSDEFCFCMSIGSSPNSSEGSDILLEKTRGGNYLANVITDKGSELVAEYKALFAEPADEPVGFKELSQRFNLSVIKPWLEKHFDHPIWEKITFPCIGCGICTYLCPTCHCFDIVDEGNLKGGRRYKNWDGCQFVSFTVHASGYNPRDTQTKRFRQRIQHKFNYYPEKFGRALCVGCGRCIRHCPVNMSLLETLETIDKLAQGR